MYEENNENMPFYNSYKTVKGLPHICVTISTSALGKVAVRLQSIMPHTTHTKVSVLSAQKHMYASLMMHSHKYALCTENTTCTNGKTFYENSPTQQHIPLKPSIQLKNCSKMLPTKSQRQNMNIEGYIYRTVTCLKGVFYLSSSQSSWLNL